MSNLLGSLEITEKSDCSISCNCRCEINSWSFRFRYLREYHQYMHSRHTNIQAITAKVIQTIAAAVNGRSTDVICVCYDLLCKRFCDYIFRRFVWYAEDKRSWMSFCLNKQLNLFYIWICEIVHNERLGNFKCSLIF